MSKSLGVYQKAIAIFNDRKLNYQFTFQPENRYAQNVLSDLAKFCRATESTFHKDPRAHAVLEGRREVWLRIQKQLNLSAEQIYNLSQKGDINGSNN